MKTFHFLAVIAAALVFTRSVESAVVDEFTGPTLHVDAANPNAGDGSASNPFKTIQAAVNAASALDQIVIAAGTYDTGTTATTLGGVSSLSRVLLDKKLYLKGAGRDLTIIRGADAAAPDVDGLGMDAVRCLYIADAAKGSLIEGITFKDGRTVTLDGAQTGSLPIWEPYGGATTNQLAYAGRNQASIGGGIAYAVEVDNTASPVPAYLVDCRVSSCRAGFSGGAVYGRMVLIRTLVDNSWAQTCYGGVLAKIRGAFSSVFASNCKISNGMGMVNTVHSQSVTQSSGYRDGVFVNCTMAGNFGRGLPQYSSPVLKTGNVALYHAFYNCVFYVNSSYRYTTTATPAYNCAQNVWGSLPNTYATTGNIGTNTDPRLDAGTGTTYGTDQFAKNGIWDWKLREGSDLIDKGNSTYIASQAAFVPEEYRATDYYAQTRVQDTAVDMGAAEGGCARSDGCVYALTASDPLYLNGFRLNSSVVGLRITDNADAVIEIRADLSGTSTKQLYGFSTSTVSNSLNNLPPWGGKAGETSFAYLFPDFDSTTVRLRIRATNDLASASYACVPAASVKWVDPVSGVDDGSHGSTSNAPFRTLQYAVNNSSANGVVFAMPGVYAEGAGACTTDSDWLQSTSNRVTISKALRLVGLEGAKKTVIMGRSTTATPEEIAAGEFVNGRCGKGALRCVGANLQYAVVQGFTLTGGATDADPMTRNTAAGKTKSSDTVEAYNWTASGICGASYNNGALTLRCRDCIISNNIAYRASAAASSMLERTLVAGNYSVNMNAETNKIVTVGGAVYYSGLADSIIYGNHTIVSASLSSTVYMNSYVGAIFHSIIAESEQNALNGANAYLYNSIVYNSTLTAGPKGSGNVVWPSAGSWTESGCRTIVDPRLRRDDAGFFIGMSSASPALTCGKWNHTYEPGNSKRYRPYYYGKSIDGLWHEPPASGNDIQTGPFCTVTEPRDWYVDAAKSDDSGDGTTPATAKKTLKAVFEGYEVSYGDTVHAAPGDYNEGTMTNTFHILTQRNVHPSRVVIPDGVTLKADEGPAVTTIWGKWEGATRSAGVNGVRGVYMGYNTKLEGFTVTHGVGNGGGGQFDDCCGGNVLAPYADDANPARISNCILSEAYARSGAAAYGGILDHCRIKDCSVSSDGIIYGSKLVNCLFTGCGSSLLRNHYGVHSCTLIGENTVGDPDFNAVGASPIENSILYYKSFGTATTLANAKNCLVHTWPNLTIAASCRNLVTNNNWASFLDTSTWRPLAVEGSSSNAVDRGDNALLAAYDDGTDLGYGQRVYNRTVDIGAYEYDMRPDYAATLLNKPSFEVTAADADVAKLSGGVEIFDGELIVEWLTGGAAITLGIDVQGNGTLSLYKGGVLVATFNSASAKTYTVKGTAGGDVPTALKFVYAKGEGDTRGAVLSGFRRNDGLLIKVK